MSCEFEMSWHVSYLHKQLILEKRPRVTRAVKNAKPDVSCASSSRARRPNGSRARSSPRAMTKCDKKFVLVLAFVISAILLSAGVEVVVVPLLGGNSSQRHEDARENVVSVGEGSNASIVMGDALGGGRALLRATEWSGRDGTAKPRASPTELGRVPTGVFSDQDSTTPRRLLPAIGRTRRPRTRRPTRERARR